MSTASPRSSPDPLNRTSMQTRLIDRVAPGWGDAIVLLGRILIGGIFVQSGFDKLMGLDAFAAGLAARGLPAPLVPVLTPIGASVEFFGGLAIVFGLMTRCAALLMIGFVIIATLISHRFWVLRRRSAAPRPPTLPRTWRLSAASYSCSSPAAAATAWSAGGAAANSSLFALAAELFELGEHGVDVELVGRLLLFGFGFAANGGLRRGQQRGALGLGVDRLFLGGAVNLEIEIDLRAQTERDRIHRLQVRCVPMGALADRLDGRLGGADEPHDLAVLELGMVAHQPEDGVRTVLAARYRRVAWALLLLRLGQPHLGIEQLEPIVRIGDGLFDLLAAELTGEHGIEALDALRGIAVGDRLHLERVKLAEVGDLIEGERGVL